MVICTIGTLTRMKRMTPGRTLRTSASNFYGDGPENALERANKPVFRVKLTANAVRRCRSCCVSSWLLIALFAVVSSIAIAQTREPTDEPASASKRQLSPLTRVSLPPVNLKSLPKNLFIDQKDFWTAPLHMSEKEWDWALPSILIGGLLIKADNTIENHVPTTKSTVSHAGTASNAGVAALAGVGAGLFLLGHVQNDDQKRETGILAGEAAI